MAEWVTQLHDDSPELGNIDTFLKELRARFEDESQAQQAEAEIHKIRQKGHPAKEYVKEVRRVVGKLCTGRNDSYSTSLRPRPRAASHVCLLRGPQLHP